MDFVKVRELEDVDRESEFEAIISPNKPFAVNLRLL